LAVSVHPGLRLGVAGRLGERWLPVRTLWKGAISFGLVHIPIRVYPATENKSVKFRYLHRECKTPIRYVKWCPSCEREVSPEEIVSGYEYQKGQFVVLEDDSNSFAVPLEGIVRMQVLELPLRMPGNGLLGLR